MRFVGGPKSFGSEPMGRYRTIRINTVINNTLVMTPVRRRKTFEILRYETHIHMSTLLPTDLIDAEEAAVLLRVAKGTIYHWIRMGYFPHYKIGRLFRLSKNDLAAFLEQERRMGIPV